MLLQISIENTGNQPVLESDYVNPITFISTQAGEIADASITDMTPSNIDLKINKIASDKAVLAPVLLNPGDKATIRFALLANNSDDVLHGMRIDGRIVGISNIELTLPSTDEPNKLLVAFVSAILGALLTKLIPAIYSLIGNLFRKVDARIS
jgi:hypothetical protein